MPVVVYKTESGSTYEVDYDGKRVRRMSGTKEPTERQGKDGEWKVYEDIIRPTIGHRLAFVWTSESVEDGLTVYRTTFTTPVTHINENGDNNES